MVSSGSCGRVLRGEICRLFMETGTLYINVLPDGNRQVCLNPYSKSIYRQVAATSFSDKRTATNAIQQNLRQNANKISDWLNNPKSKDFLVTETTHDFSIGKGVEVNVYGTASKNITYGLNKSQIFMVKDAGMPNGYKIITAYPVFD
jgi:hypothetical protein